MQRDLLDSLRCPAVHDESWLVAIVHTAAGSELIDADLACPVCGAEFRVANGVAYFAETTPYVGDAAVSDEYVLRIAALLGVAESQQPIALVGRYAALSEPIAAYVSAPQLLVNADFSTTAEGASRMIVRDRLPLGVATLSAVAVDATYATASMLDSAARALRVGGRLVAPATVAVPAGMREIVRDDDEWVAETTTRASGIIELRRRAP